MLPQYIKNIIIKTYKRNVQYKYNFWYKNMKNKALVTVPMVPIFVNVPFSVDDTLWSFVLQMFVDLIILANKKMRKIKIKKWMKALELKKTQVKIMKPKKKKHKLKSKSKEQ
jgi:hypothetical protein